MRAGAIPVLADIEPDSGLLAIESARRCVSPRTRAIVLVHLYGQVRDMVGWEDLCREHAIELIEDCAQSHLSCWDGVTAGAFRSDERLVGHECFRTCRSRGSPYPKK